MSPEPDIIVTIDKEQDILVSIDSPTTIQVETPTNPDVLVIAAGNVGPRGPDGKWEAMTQSEYDALSPPDPDILYIIIQ